MKIAIPNLSQQPNCRIHFQDLIVQIVKDDLDSQKTIEKVISLDKIERTVTIKTDENEFDGKTLSVFVTIDGLAEQVDIQPWKLDVELSSKEQNGGLPILTQPGGNLGQAPSDMNQAPKLVEFDLDSPIEVKQGDSVSQDMAPYVFDPDEDD